ncbi:hypothetical protein [Agromyces sp. NPDC058104]|uniref:phage tail tube protein n=1 Tax=Agromyces sp. NPDC058104 TaxID=3346342 RepID=UPI0036DB3FC1
MTDVKYLTNKRLTVWAALASGNPFVDPSHPTDDEINAMLNISDAVRANGYSFGVQATPSTDDRSLTDDASAQGDGFMNFGGDIPAYTPSDYTNVADILQKVWVLTKAQGTVLWIVTRLGKPNNSLAAPGDVVSVFRVKTDGQQHNTEGAGGRIRMLSVQPDGEVYPNILVADTTPVAVTATGPATASVGDPFYANALLSGLNITRDAIWTSSDPTKVFSDGGGVFIPLAAGAVTLVASYPGATAATAIPVTVS